MVSQTEAKVENCLDRLFLRVKDDDLWSYSESSHRTFNECGLVVPDGIKLTLTHKYDGRIVLYAETSIAMNDKDPAFRFISDDTFFREYKCNITDFKIEDIGMFALDNLFLQVKDNDLWSYSVSKHRTFNEYSLTVPLGIKLTLMCKNDEDKILCAGIKIVTMDKRDSFTLQNNTLCSNEYKFNITGFKIDEE